MNWRGRPLTSHEVIVNTIAATTTRTGLTRPRRTGHRQLPDRDQDQRRADGRLTPHPPRLARRLELHPAPRPATRPAAPARRPPPPPGPPARPGRFAHPALTGLSRQELDGLATTLALPWNAWQEALRYTRRGGPRRRPPRKRRTLPARPPRPDRDYPDPPAPVPSHPRHRLAHRNHRRHHQPGNQHHPPAPRPAHQPGHAHASPPSHTRRPHPLRQRPRHHPPPEQQPSALIICEPPVSAN